ncbi:calcium-activated chloride channel regulator 4A-like isoform X2 [Branchiostoma floridae x Branchiostoma japonicum]
MPRHAALTSLTVALVFLFTLCAANTHTRVKFENNAYSDLVVAIHPDVPEDLEIIDRIKSIVTDASEYLHITTRQRAYFGGVSILVPETWQDRPEYESATWETYDTSDVRIAEPNPEFDHNPYVRTFSGCGEKGEYMHLTPGFILDQVPLGSTEVLWGPSGRVFIHEWGHLRYGVFDEYGIPAEGYPNFYFNENGRITVTGCKINTRGYSSNYRTGGRCSMDSATGLPDSECQFFPYLNQGGSGHGSVMYMQFLDAVDHFCDDSDGDHKHNADAPNKQNRVCDGRSTWDVVTSTEDFKAPDGTQINTARAVASTEPTFRVVKARKPRYVLVFDISGSMDSIDDVSINTPRRSLLHQTVYKLVREGIPYGSHVGMVKFDQWATRLLDLTEIVTEEDRQEIADAVPNEANGATCIGCGLMEALEVLSMNGADPAGGIVIILSDGGENAGLSPNLTVATQHAVAAGVTVHSVTYSSSADQRMEEVAASTHGRAFFYSGAANSNSLEEGLREAVRVQNSAAARASSSLQLYSNAVKLEVGQTFNATVLLDSSVGENTEFSFGWTAESGVDWAVTSPSGTVYTNSSVQVFYNHQAKIATLKLQGKAQAGSWLIHVANPAPSAQRVVLTVNSRPSAAEPPITANAWLSNSDLQVWPPKAVVYAEVTQGLSPIVGAHVMATVQGPDNQQNSYILQLRDDGAGADLTRNDGTYSAYFTQFTGVGRYSVSAAVTNPDGQAQLKTSVAGSAAPFQDPSKAPTSTTSYQPVESFERQSAAGVFQLLDYKSEDGFPPSRITDLEVVKVSYTDRTVLLRWTAPGDDYDQGQASQYDMRMSRDTKSLRAGFDRAAPVNGSMVTSGSLTNPVPAGSHEYIQVLVPLTDDKTIVFAVTALDDNGNTGGNSNFVSVTFDYQDSYGEGSDSGSGLSAATIGAIVGGVLGAALIIGASIVIAVKISGSKTRIREIRITPRDNMGADLPPYSGPQGKMDMTAHA